jgi:endonuclease G
VFTATNIDGSAAVPIKRARNPWAFDPRIPRAVQVGAELYRDNDFDRGHLTRRLDPAWGPDAVEAEADTFFYTNATPQHLEFNQHLWERLESCLLDNSQTLGFSASVFTGPVFADTDRAHRGVAIPQSFWKVAVMVDADTGRLSATAYLLSQADLITGVEFVFGQFKTYQLPVADVERLTGLDFGKLRRADPLRARGAGARELRRPEDITLGEVRP